MKDYRHFLNENATNTYIDIIQWLADNGFQDSVSSDDNVKKYYTEEQKTKTVSITIYAETPKDRENTIAQFASFLKEKNIPYTQKKISGSSKGRTEISYRDTKDKNIWIMYKYLTRGIDVQELMVAGLVLNGKKYEGRMNLEQCDTALSNISNSLSSIKGVKDVKKFQEGLDKNYLDLAPSISSSNSILRLIQADGQTIQTAYWTGQTWDKEIQFLNPPTIGKVKNYNSSDVIFKTEGIEGTVFYGFSLKKKAKITDADPTLINKTITGERSFLDGIVPQNEIDEIENAKEEFFKMVVNKEKGLNLTNYKDVKNEISTIENDVVGNYLKSGNNIFFKTIDKILPKYSKKFTTEFLDEVFKVKLSETQNFKFNLNTGIGRVDKTGVIIENAENKDLKTTIEVLTDIYSGELSLRHTPEKKQAWEDDSGAAKIFYTIFATIDNIEKPIVNIEIRYKGSFTAEPQFQAVARPDFKNLFKND
jgi:chaperonin cofactor prefoldin